MLSTVCWVLLLSGASSSRPNIVVLLADDLGYNDVSWHNTKVLMPHLHNLAKSGIILQQHYSQPSCTPSRGSLLTGRYPVNIQLNPGAIFPQVPFGLPTQYPTLADMLRSEGYATHAVGKWHLGFCNKKFLPTNRGFDHHYGFWLGAQGYYNHIRDRGYDLRSDLNVVHANNLTYSTDLFGYQAANIISNHKKSKAPMFLYLAFQSVHTPLQVPAEYEALYREVRSRKRRKYLGMVTAMDRAVGQVVTALKDNGMLEETVILFMSDNGGPVDQGADNYPLRGGKGSLWEGGTRTPAFITGHHLLPREEPRMIHISDWLPTLLDMAGIRYSKARLDGVSHWDSLAANSSTWTREDMLYNVKSKTKAAMRHGDWKLVLPDKLYNLGTDMGERRNMASSNQEMVRNIMTRLGRYTQNIARLKYPEKRAKGHARYWNGTWTYGWC